MQALCQKRPSNANAVLKMKRLNFLAAAYDAHTDEEARSAQEELDAYVDREAENHGTSEEEESQSRNQSRGRDI